MHSLWFVYMETKMLNKVSVIVVVFMLTASSVYAQEPFVRFGIGSVDFEKGITTPPPGEIHFHEAAFTANFALGYGWEYFRAMALFDPSIVDGVEGTSIVSGGVKGEIGMPFIKWLKLGGGIMYSHNHAKRNDHLKFYERDGLDTVTSPFWSISFLPRAEGPIRFFADIRIGKSYGGDIIQPQTGNPVARSYVSVSLGAQIH